MGLAEKRFQQEFTNEEIPKALKYYSEQTGGATDHLKVEIDWASIGDDKDVYDNMKSVWQQPLQGIEGVCADDMGKTGVKEGLKKIVIKNVKGASSAEMKDGVLTANMNLANGTQGSLGWSEYQKIVENAL